MSQGPRAEPPSLEFLREPALVLTLDGTVLGANAAARRLLAQEPVGCTLTALVEGEPHEPATFLRQAAGSTAPRLGALAVKGRDGGLRMRAEAARLPGPGGPCLVLRLHYPQEDQLALLDRRVRLLNAQLRRRMQENMALQAALDENRVLLRELQHRVKNNIQIMLSLIGLSARGGRTPEVARLVQTARLRLEAMASTQEAIYRSQHAGTVSTAAVLPDLLRSIAASFGARDRLEISIADIELQNDEAHALALVVTELTTNAIKHGLPAERGAANGVRVELRRADGSCELVVADCGAGLPAGVEARASGLRLVRGLCRQLGGTLEIGHGSGTRCTVRFAPAGRERRE